MRLRSAWLALGVLGAVTAVAPPVIAGPALDDNQPAAAPATAGAPTATTDDVPDPNANQDDEPEYGVGLRFRGVFLPKSILELFVKRAPGGVSNPGLGIELTRRKHNTELQIAVEVEHLQVPQGVWINKNDNVPQDEVDYQLNEGGLGWVTFEFNFINHVPITKWVAFRYGFGAGLGVIFGQDKHVDVLCSATSTNTNVDPGCTPPEFGGQATDTHGGAHIAYNLPPVFPVLTALVGFQFRPLDKLTINVEGGIRTLPFFGVSAGYFF